MKVGLIRRNLIDSKHGWLKIALIVVVLSALTIGILGTRSYATTNLWEGAMSDGGAGGGTAVATYAYNYSFTSSYPQLIDGSPNGITFTVGWYTFKLANATDIFSFDISFYEYTNLPSAIVFFDSTGNIIDSIETPGTGVHSVNAAGTQYVQLRSTTTAIREFTLSGDAVPVTPVAPLNLLASPSNAQVNLSWDAVTGASTYNIQRSTTQGGPYSVIDSVYGTTYNDTAVVNGTTYYYVLTAVNTSGESNPSNEASATPQAPPAAAGQALLVVTLVSGLEKEYDLTMAEVNAFIDWYDNRAAGTGPERYEIEKDYNKGPFTSRKDNLVFDKIMTFEVMEYNSISN